MDLKYKIRKGRRPEEIEEGNITKGKIKERKQKI